MRLDLGPVGKTLVFSDFHVGDPRFCDCLLHAIWKEVQIEKAAILVFAGDVLEANLASAEQKAKLKSVCGLVDQVVILNGNHDTKETQKFAHAVKAKFATQITGISCTATFAIEHGNRFDSAWHKVPGLGRLAIWANRWLYKLTKFDFQKWLRGFKFVEKKLLEQHLKAQQAWQGKDIVVTGHTHLPTNDPEGVGYFNSGDWLYHRTYVVINSGRAELRSVL